MASEDIKIKAEAGQLLAAGHSEFEGYRRMDTAKLKTMIAKANKPVPAKGKGKASVNGTKGKAKAATVVKGKSTKGKVAPTKGRAKSAPAAKSTARKSAPAKGKATASKGKVKRPTTGATKGKATTTAKRGRPVTGKVVPVTERPKAARRTKTGMNAQPVVSNIKNSKINWNRESGVGRTGKRAKVMDALREFKGDKAKAFKKLKRYAAKWYPTGGHLGNAEGMLVWLIGRVAYDFVMATGQHEPGRRAAYGTSESPQDIKRREAREASKPKRRGRPASSKPTAKSTSAKGSGKGKAAPAKRGRPKGSRNKTTAPAKGKVTKRQSKPASRGKGKGRR